MILLFGKNTKNNAKRRLVECIAADRRLTANIFDEMRKEIENVLKKYGSLDCKVTLDAKYTGKNKVNIKAEAGLTGFGLR